MKKLLPYILILFIVTGFFGFTQKVSALDPLGKCQIFNSASSFGTSDGDRTKNECIARGRSRDAEVIEWRKLDSSQTEREVLRPPRTPAAPTTTTTTSTTSTPCTRPFKDATRPCTPAEEAEEKAKNSNPSSTTPDPQDPCGDTYVWYNGSCVPEGGYVLLAPITAANGEGTGEIIYPGEKGILGTYLNMMIKLIIGLAAVFAVVMIVIGGMEYMTSELISGKEAGKERIRDALLGLIVALGAYALLNTINPKLFNTEIEFPDATVSVNLLTELSNGSYSSTGGAGAGGGGSCNVTPNPNNACSTTTLASSCFGNRASEASKICNVESAGGLTNVKSGSDLLNKGDGPSYSVGLWQINLTANKVGGLNCPAAFSGRCGRGTATPSNNGPFVGGPKVGNCSQTIVNQALYDACVAAAQDPVKNTQAACDLYNSGGFKPWAYTANKCNIP